MDVTLYTVPLARPVVSERVIRDLEYVDLPGQDPRLPALYRFVGHHPQRAKLGSSPLPPQI